MTKMTVSQWKEMMTDTNDYGESAYALHLIIMRSAVCDACRFDDHFSCAGEAWDIIAGKPIDCHCIICPVYSDILLDQFYATFYADDTPVYFAMADGSKVVADLTTPIYDQLLKERHEEAT